MIQWLAPRTRPAPPAPARHSVEELRCRTLELLDDCPGSQDTRLRSQLNRAWTAQQLWQARCEIYQAIAQQHCEAEATRRLNALTPFFEGWLPPEVTRPLERLRA